METVWRVAAVYFFLIVTLRLMGKRDLGQLAPFDLVILLMIPELVAQAMVREDFSLTNAFIAVSTLLTLAFITSVIAFRFRTAGRIIEGEPTVLVRYGHLIQAAMTRERVDPHELVAQMHTAGLEEMSQVKWGILETDGMITFIPWEGSSGRQHTPKDTVK